MLPPSVFWPRPKVSSAFVQIALDPALAGASPTGRSSTTSCGAIFCHRRKFLRSELLGACKDRLDKAGVDRILARLGLDGTQRAERLDPEAMLALCEAVRETGISVNG